MLLAVSSLRVRRSLLENEPARNAWSGYAGQAGYHFLIAGWKVMAFIVGLTKVSKRKLIGIWKTSVVDVYEEAIMNGDKEYFINKDYSEDLGEGGTDRMMNVIEDVRSLIRNTSEENKDKAIKYLQNLTKICKLYYAN